MKKNTKREGFTLVELLIVIVVIGVLSAMMMLSSTEAVSSAKAADIVSDLRNLKTAALAWYADHLDDISGLGDSSNQNAGLNKKRTEIAKYLNNGTLDDKYTFGGKKSDNTWYVWCKVDDTKVKEKLKSRKGSVGLCGSASDAYNTTSADYEAQTYVGMFIR